MLSNDLITDLSVLVERRRTASEDVMQIQKMVDQLRFVTENSRWDFSDMYYIKGTNFPVLNLGGYSLNVFTGFRDRLALPAIERFLMGLLDLRKMVLAELDEEFEARIALHFKENSK